MHLAAWPPMWPAGEDQGGGVAPMLVAGGSSGARSASHAVRRRRILVIDDNPAIASDFRKVLCPEQRADDGNLDELEDAIFGADVDGADLRQRDEYVVDSAAQGQEGYELIQRMKRQGTPYALAFVDIRMPPGWDGIETLEHIWADTPELEAVICSAYSDHVWSDVLQRLGRPDLQMLSKPFDSAEVQSLARSLTSRWLERHGTD